VPPFHLDLEVLDYLAEPAKAQGISLSSLVNILLRKNMGLIDAIKQLRRCSSGRAGQMRRKSNLGCHFNSVSAVASVFHNFS
jgi:hypothetical protein